ncbi:MAG: hypothetical protein HRT67_10565 [Flavobacteriaceae bacterium]|nr:hypothetical protein [Flavobacteriaceae bacterium]
MAETIILANGRAYQRSAFGEVRFYSKGWVIGFELNEVYYTSLYSNKGTGAFAHFIKAEEYRKYKNLEGNKRKEALSPHYLSQSTISQYLAIPGDTINIQVRKRTTENDGTYKLCAEVKSWEYSGEIYNTTPYSPVLSPPSDDTEVTSSGLEDCLYVTPEGQQIYDMAKRRIGNFSGDLVWDMDVVEDVVEILSKLKPDVTGALQNLGMINLYNEEISLWNQEADLGYYYYTNNQLIAYRDYLIAFNKWYDDKRERFQTENNVSDLYWLGFFLDEKILTTIPYQDKIRVLDKFLTENIDERYITDLSGPLREPVVLKLFRTINDNEASDFLEALLERPKIYKDDGITVLKNLDVYDTSIRLRALYKAIDDKRFTIFGNDNRKKFTEIITALWKKSKYSFYSYNQPTDNDQNLDTTSYFNNEGLRYFIDDENPYWYIQNTDKQHLGEPVIELGYTGTWYNEQNQIQNIGPITFNYNWKYTSGSDNDFVNEIITIHQSKDYTLVYGDVVLNGLEFVESKHELKYHVYQPIKFLQYDEEGNRMLSVETIPALSFFYEQEYQKLKELDAAIVFAAELSLEVLFFAISGGASALAQVRHLRHVTKLGRGISGVGNAVKVWRGAEITLEALSFSTGVISSTFNYLASTADVNSPEYEKYKDLRAFFGLLALTSGVGAIGARSLAVKKATKLVNKMDVDGVVYNIDPELETIIRTIGNSDIFIDQMRSYLTFLQDQHQLTNLLNRFNNLTELKKIAFYEDFNDLKNINAWTEISNSNEAFDNWLALKNVDSPDAKIISVIVNQQRTVGLVRYLEIDVFKEQFRFLSDTERIRLVDRIGDINDTDFNLMVETPNAIRFISNNLSYYNYNPRVILTLEESLDVLRNIRNNYLLGVRAKVTELHNLNEVADTFETYIQNGKIIYLDTPPSTLKNIRDSYINHSLIQARSADEIERFKKMNIMPTEFKIYNDNNLLLVENRTYLSVTPANAERIIGVDAATEFNIQRPPISQTTPKEHFKFTKKATANSDDNTLAYSQRHNDTETYMIYDTFDNYINFANANKIEITFTSPLYTCRSCRRFILGTINYYEEVLKPQGFELIIKMKSSTRVKGMKEGVKDYNY